MFYFSSFVILFQTISEILLIFFQILSMLNFLFQQVCNPLGKHCQKILRLFLSWLVIFSGHTHSVVGNQPRSTPRPEAGSTRCWNGSVCVADHGDPRKLCSTASTLTVPPRRSPLTITRTQTRNNNCTTPPKWWSTGANCLPACPTFSRRPG